MPGIDTVRDTLKVLNTDGLYNANKSIIKKAIQNKTFINGTIDGYTAVAIDGTKFFGSYKKCCPKCLTTVIKGKQYYQASGTDINLLESDTKY